MFPKRRSPGAQALRICRAPMPQRDEKGTLHLSAVFVGLRLRLRVISYPKALNPKAELSAQTPGTLNPKPHCSSE